VGEHDTIVLSDISLDDKVMLVHISVYDTIVCSQLMIILCRPT
jgi:hypothetical protein